MIKPNFTIKTAFTILSLALTTHSYGASIYISDELFVPVRKGQGNQFTILHKGLASGTRVTLVERDTEWTKVTTSDGITGWVRNQFLSDEPPAKLKLTVANEKIERLTQQLAKISEDKQQLQQELTQTSGQLQQTDQLARNTEEELVKLKSISSSAVETHQRLQKLAEKMQLLQTENDVLKSENEGLRNSERTKFFMYGVFAVLLGVLVAVVVPKLRGRKRNDGWVN